MLAYQSIGDIPAAPDEELHNSTGEDAATHQIAESIDWFLNGQQDKTIYKRQVIMYDECHIAQST